MKTEKKLNGQPIAKTEEKAILTVVKTDQPLTVEDLLKKISELETRLNNKPLSLDEQIKFFEEKQKKIQHLELFKLKKIEIEETLSVIIPIADNQEFEKEYYKLTLEHNSYNHRGKPVFEISNPLVIANCAAFILKAVDEKINTLVSEIQA